MIRRNLVAEDENICLDEILSPEPGNKDMKDEELSAGLLRLLHAAAEKDASDIHLVPGYPATIRVHGCLETLSNTPLDADELERMLRSLLPPGAESRQWDHKSFDSSVSIF
ncbi:MAG: hypothetical protein ABIG44_09400, partial [Planctomycetota bacterium]